MTAHPPGPVPTPQAARTSSLRRWLARIVGVGLLLAAAYVLWRTFRTLSPAEVAAAMRAWGPLRISGAVALSAASFMLLGVLEWLGLRWTGGGLPLATAMRRSLVVNGLTHSLGANIVVATLARTWAYKSEELSLLPSATLTVFVGMSFAAGLAALVGCGLLLASPAELAALRFLSGHGRLVAWLLLAAVAAYVLACALWPGVRTFRGVAVPSGGLAVAQVVIGVADNALSAAILWLLIGPELQPFSTFVFTYALACLAGLASAAPGGVGVFEGALAALAPELPAQALAAGFIGFRIVFYLLPLIVALVLAGLGARRRG